MKHEPLPRASGRIGADFPRLAPAPYWTSIKTTDGLTFSAALMTARE